MKEKIHHCNVCGLDFENTEATPKVCALCGAPMAASKPKAKTVTRKKRPRRVIKAAKASLPSDLQVAKDAATKADDAFRNDLKVLSETITSESDNTVEDPPAAPRTPKVKKRLTSHAIMLTLSAAGAVFGAMGTVIYFFSQNMIIGAPAVIIGVAGIIAFKYYWGKGGEMSTEQHEGVPQTQVDCLNIYRDVLVFENWHGEKAEPGGYIWQCLNDKKHYYVNTHEQTKAMADTRQLSPFVLPDQLYYDPEVFAERVLELPAHRQAMKRKEKASQVIKTALLVVTIVILFFLILVTTPTGG